MELGWLLAHPCLSVPAFAFPVLALQVWNSGYSSHAVCWVGLQHSYPLFFALPLKSESFVQCIILKIVLRFQPSRLETEGDLNVYKVKLVGLCYFVQSSSAAALVTCPQFILH